ncbi:MAG: metallophosphoesterase family protein [Candidatus Gastranaerophilales bacterium]|nr:metallophosphoesterase family protein [Candidatus Gastranaerophilales bacterium]
MKIAIISDIHANKDAFEKVMDNINQFEPDKIFCLGDLILAGYNPNYICEKILELKEKYGENFEIIQGNTDKMVSNCNNELLENAKKSFPCMGYSLEEDIKITDKKYLDFVRELPEKKQVIVNGIKIDLVHGSPRNQSENIYPELMNDTVEEMISGSDADIILCGHTHLPCGYTLNSGKTVINVGSVGRSMTKDKNAVYLQLTIDSEGRFYSEHKIVKYDNEKVSKHILARNFKYCEELASMYIA